MKLTTNDLRRIIAEEIQNVINKGSMTADPELMLIHNELNGDSVLASEVLMSMVEGLPYMQAIEIIKVLSEKMPGKFQEILEKL